jgi:hypothetical protein
MTILANDTKLVSIPAVSVVRKLPLIFFQNSASLSLVSNLNASASMDLIEKRSSSYMPVIKAMVPPDTPGTTSAAPMHNPFT